MEQNQPSADATVVKIDVVVSRYGRSGFKVDIIVTNDDGTWGELTKKFLKTTLGQVRSEMFKYKQEWIQQGQNPESISIRYI